MDMPTKPRSTLQTLRHDDELPGPRALPVFGNLLQIESTRLHLQLEQWCEEFGSVFKLRLGPRRAIVVGDHELIATALRDRPDGFRRSLKFEQVWIEMGMQIGVFGASGETWRFEMSALTALKNPNNVVTIDAAALGLVLLEYPGPSGNTVARIGIGSADTWGASTPPSILWNLHGVVGGRWEETHLRALIRKAGIAGASAQAS